MNQLPIIYNPRNLVLLFFILAASLPETLLPQITLVQHRGKQEISSIQGTSFENNQAALPLLNTNSFAPLASSDNELFLPFTINSVSMGLGDCLTAEELELVNLVNQYRVDHGLANVPVSRSLTQVAQYHVLDLHWHDPDTGSDHGYTCNMHSWSDQGFWSPVCYTSDHAYASGMWDKPREITNNYYKGNGYENAYGSYGQATADDAFTGWINSPGHNDVILELGDWSGSNWPAMGVGIYQHHAVLWFGDQPDPQGIVDRVCDVYQ